MQEKIHETVNFSIGVADFSLREAILILAERFFNRVGRILPRAERISERKAAL